MSEYIGQFILGIMSGICPIFHGKVSHANLARIKGKTHQTPIYIQDTSQEAVIIITKTDSYHNTT